MRRIVSLAAAIAVAAAVATPLSAHAGVAGELDAFAEALGDLASATEGLAGTLDDTVSGDEGPGGVLAGHDGVWTTELAGAVDEMHRTTARVAVAGVPVADHLARQRLAPAALHDALDTPVHSLARAIHELGVVSDPVNAQLWGGRVGTAAAAPPPGELLAPAIQAMARALDTFSPALEALAPVIEPLAPVIGPACGQVPGVVFLALGLAPVLVPVPLPSLPTSPAVLAGSVLAPAFLLCAALPTPSPDAPGAEEDPGTAEPPDSFAETPPPAPPRSGPSSGGRAATEPSPGREDGAFSSARLSPGSSPAVATPDPSSSGAAVMPTRVGLRQLPLLPVDHDGEATSIALVVLLLAATAGVVAFLARRRPAAPSDWSVPGAAAAGVGALAAGGMAWSGAAEQVAPWAQVPYLISGGMTALVLGVVAATLALARPVARLAGERD